MIRFKIHLAGSSCPAAGCQAPAGRQPFLGCPPGVAREPFAGRPLSVLPVAVCLAVGLSGCAGPQSTLDPAGTGAKLIAELFWWLMGGATVIWLAVMGLAVYALRVRHREHDRRQAAILIIGGGAVLPTLVLAAYLSVGLSMMPALLEPAPEGSLRMHVTGEQWWWRVFYELPDGEVVELANEVRLPVGEKVDIFLDSPDVIHSFWIPNLGGKIDMVPGRVNRLTLEPTRTGVFRGACAEYCGGAHALMMFPAVVMERDAFDEWLGQQARPADGPQSAIEARGAELILSHGCGSCHAVRGTQADGAVGPDLTHIGSRLTIGGGLLPNEPEEMYRWIAYTDSVKPGVHMPAFSMLPEDDLRAIAAYLSGLE